MKPVSVFSGALLATSMLVAPAALAQQTEPAPQPQPQAEDVVTVRGQYIPEPQRRTAQVASFVTLEDLDRTGDGDAALALARVSGLSIVRGQYAYVRGLGDRYSAALLNGSPLPSPEPLRRIVPLDLFPSEILDGIAVQKTYSANYPGEFGGGVIDLRTLRRPEESFLNLSVGTSYNTVTTGRNGIFHRGSSDDWTSWDGGYRDQPEPLRAIIANQTALNDLSTGQLETLTESLVIPNLLIHQQGTLGADFNAAFDGGFAFEAGGIDFGLIAAGGFDSGWTTQESQRQRVRGDVIGSEFDVFTTALDTQVNALASLTGEVENHSVSLTSFFVRSVRKDTQLTRGEDFNAPGGRPLYEESTGWYERELGMVQLAGEHSFGNLEANWRGSFARATRDTPFLQRLRRFEDATGTPIYSTSNQYTIEFTELTDDLYNFGGDLNYAFTLPGARELLLTVGGDRSRTERTFETLFFRMAGGNSLPDDVQRARPDFLFSADNIGPGRFLLAEVQNTQSNYTGDLEVDALFAQADLDITPFIRGTFGVRYEDAVQSVQTFSRFGVLGRGAVLANDYILPSATVTWNFADDLQLRVGYSETIGRPQFRELANSSFFDPESQRSFRGFDGLVDTTMRNYDARLEYYLGRNQFVTGAVFFKQIENPIEEVQFETASFVTETTFFNSPEAELTGLELEYRQTFEFPLDMAWFRDRDWRFGVNYTYTRSEVIAPAGTLVLDPISDSLRDAAFFNLDGAKLQGTPENVVNAQFGWETDNAQLTLLLNWVDERILQRGFDSPSGVLPDVIEEPGVQLDLVYRRSFNVMGREVRLGLSGRNLLDEQSREFQRNDTIGETEFNTYERGRTFSVSLSTGF